MFRFLDVLLSILGLLLGFPVFVVLYLFGLFDTGSPIFRQERIGMGKKPFVLVKFRTMAVGSASVGTHLIPPSSVTKYGSFLRKSKLDEMPQLWNVLKGDMSFVGPRPCLFNQEQLIECRERLQIFDVRPGITGLAQVNGVDMSTPERLGQVDAEMIKGRSISNYFKYIFMTVSGGGAGDRVSKV